jgi:hypothetical protein
MRAAGRDFMQRRPADWYFQRKQTTDLGYR